MRAVKRLEVGLRPARLVVESRVGTYGGYFWWVLWRRWLQPSGCKGREYWGVYRVPWGNCVWVVPVGGCSA